LRYDIFIRSERDSILVCVAEGGCFVFFVHFSNVWKLTCKYFLCMFLDPGIMLCSDLLE